MFIPNCPEKKPREKAHRYHSRIFDYYIALGYSKFDSITFANIKCCRAYHCSSMATGRPNPNAKRYS